MKEVCRFLAHAGVAVALSLFPTRFSAAVFEVGVGKPFSTPGQVPWETLQAGDTVLIHHRPEPYRDKWVICRQGTAGAPITVCGVPGPNGERPVLDGRDAITRPVLNYWGEARAVFKVGGASVPQDTMPRFIKIENLEVRSARPPHVFRSASGAVASYVPHAASIWIEKGENITIRNCVIHDSGNGLFVSSGNTQASRDIVIESCRVFDNGNTNSVYEHNAYTEAAGILYQFNWFGPLRAGCPGSNLKDRSAGTVIRYNWIEGGNRELVLVDAEGSQVVREDPRYRQTYVYGNIIIEPANDGNKQVVQYGGDSGMTNQYRKGTLYFYNNTLLSRRTDLTTWFRLSTNDESADVRNNIFDAVTPGRLVSLTDSDGHILLSHNWLKSGWVASFSGLTGSITQIGTNLAGTVPGFVGAATGRFQLVPTSACRDAGALAHPNTTAHPVRQQYAVLEEDQARPVDRVIDMGAFEFETAFRRWARLRFGSEADDAAFSGVLADPDNDGSPNLLEFAFGTEPLLAHRALFPLVTRNAEGAPVEITFPRQPAPCGIQYAVQESNDFASWSNAAVFSDVTNAIINPDLFDATPPGATNQVLRWRGSAPETGRFFRVRIIGEDL